MFFTERLMQFLAPATCLLCFSEGAALCATCSAQIVSPAPGCCYVCLVRTKNGVLCDTCLPDTPFSGVFAACAYENVNKKVIHAFKFSHQRSLATAMADKLVTSLPPLSKDVVVTHIPTSAAHIRERGYDQALLLARAVANRLQLPHASLLERIGKTRQLGASRRERRVQMAGAFRPVKPYIINGANLLLVDDVITTGSSLEAAARILQNAGAQSITAAVFAQAL